MLQVGYNDDSTWSSIPISEGMYFRTQALFSFYGKVLLCGGVTAGGNNGITTYEPDTHDFETVDLQPESNAILGRCGAAAPIVEGRTFGIFGGKEDMYSFARITLED